jgi:tetratricopeptide (TPR) repeat protein
MPTIPERMKQALAHHQAGRLAEAEAIYRDVLHEDPRQPHALHLLGVIAHQAGRHREALDLIGRALAAGPHPVFLSNLSAVHLALRQFDQAAAAALEAIRLNPAFADAHNNLGVALRELGRLAEAEAAFRAALQCNPRHADARSNLGAALHRQGRLPEALAVLREAVRLAPSHAQSHNDLGGVLLARGETEEAAGRLREALRLDPTCSDAHNNLGVALRDMGRIDEAMSYFREVLRLKPDSPTAHNNIGFTLEAQGHPCEALAEFQEALRLEPNNSMALLALSALSLADHYDFTDDELGRLEALASRPDLPDDERSRVHFALARAGDRAGAHGEAFAHYRRGNELRKATTALAGITYDAAAHCRLVDQLASVFTPDWFEQHRSFGSDSELPVFVVGMMRSGTTLAEQILASHPRVFGAGELSEVGRLVGALPGLIPGGRAYPECLAGLDTATARGLAERHLTRLHELGGGAARVIDKQPFNFQHLGVIATLFPRARVIHCRRDPIDTCLSCFVQYFGKPHPFALDLAHLGHYYREYERLMAHWRRVLPVPVFELHYEELTADQEAVSRRLVEFCGLEWDERCLRFHETRRPVRTASTLQVRRPMYRTSVGRWKRYEAQLGPLLDALGLSGPGAAVIGAEPTSPPRPQP